MREFHNPSEAASENGSGSSEDVRRLPKMKLRFPSTFLNKKDSFGELKARRE